MGELRHLRRKLVREPTWPPPDGLCPMCSARLQHHSKSAWCLRCGWALNREHEPGGRA